MVLDSRYAASLALLALVGCSSTTLPTSVVFPPLGRQLESAVHPLGTGECATRRTGLWQAEGGVVVEIEKPKGGGECNFSSLNLVIDGQSIPSTALDAGFFCRPHGQTLEPRCVWYRGDSGKVFFKTNLAADPAKVRGIVEPNCRSSSCLNEPGALKR